MFLCTTALEEAVLCYCSFSVHLQAGVSPRSGRISLWKSSFYGKIPWNSTNLARAAEHVLILAYVLLCTTALKEGKAAL